jgi:hypothetical protein
MLISDYNEKMLNDTNYKGFKGSKKLNWRNRLLQLDNSHLYYPLNVLFC